ncbi:energy-coupling factor transporter transmembrane protein EcfT [Clostridia bacterium]|nr:energy-coupling factor transporter transmembrane protein EcfT [Clostridia bacterium]
MNTRISFGQFYPADSYIHKLDPRVKLVSVFIYIVMIFAVESVPSYFFVMSCLFVAMYASHVPFRFVMRGLRAIWFMMFFTVALNIFFTPSDEYLVHFYFIKISADGLVFAAKMAVRLFLLVTASSLLTLTTTPLSLSDAIEFLLKPLAKIGFPAAEVAMMMTISLRFIPTLMDETDKIIKAQKARGADFETGSIMKRVQMLVPILVPLFVSAFRRAEELATAMEARCYRPESPRTKMKALKFERIDYIAVVCVIVFIPLVIVSRNL